MNRSKQPLTKKNEKKVKKEVHSAQKTALALKKDNESDQLTAQELKKRFPKKPVKKQMGLFEKIKKTLSMKKNKQKKVSKRTTPGKTIGQQAAPAVVHKEGKRWSKILTLQAKIQRKTRQRKSLKGK